LAVSASVAQASLAFVPEQPAHAPAIERVLDRAFGPGRFAKPSELVRDISVFLPGLSRVALVGPAVLGVCRIYESAIDGRPVFFLGPLAVDPDSQHGGVGHALVKAALEACAADGRAGAVILMGEPSFFSTLGFTQVPARQIQMPCPVEWRRLQWTALRDGGLDSLAGSISRLHAASRA
jgi:predicted N-acetyltransferase YhbS